MADLITSFNRVCFLFVIHSIIMAATVSLLSELLHIVFLKVYMGHVTGMRFLVSVSGYLNEILNAN